MNDSRRRVLRRVLRALAASIVATLLVQLPLAADVLPRSEIVVPLATAILMGLDKLLRERA